MSQFIVPRFKPEVADTGRIRVGAGYRPPPVTSPAVADAAKIRFGAGYRLPASKRSV